MVSPNLQGGAVGLAKLRLDGFTSLDPAGTGMVTTKLVRMSSDRLILNANAAHGSTKVEILDHEGNPIKGFIRDDSDAVSGDSARHVVTWRGYADASVLKNRSIALKFYLDRCKLYSFAFRAAERKGSE